MAQMAQMAQITSSKVGFERPVPAARRPAGGRCGGCSGKPAGTRGRVCRCTLHASRGRCAPRSLVPRPAAGISRSLRNLRHLRLSYRACHIPPALRPCPSSPWPPRSAPGSWPRPTSGWPRRKPPRRSTSCAPTPRRTASSRTCTSASATTRSRIFQKHGMTNVIYLAPMDAPASQNTLVYLLSHQSREAAKASWGRVQERPRVEEGCLRIAGQWPDRHQGGLGVPAGHRLLADEVRESQT
jgi:hypothetical protein